MTDNEGATVRYDDGCRLCRAAVRFAKPRDRQQHFTFVPLTGRETIPGPGDTTCACDTILLEDHDGIHDRSDAVLRVLAGLGRPWSALRVLRVVPRPVRDAVYDLVARHRHRWFGRV